jgi:hypothetical protein
MVVGLQLQGCMLWKFVEASLICLASQAYIVASGRKGVAVKSKSEANNNIEVLVV